MHAFNPLYTIITILVVMGVLQGACAYLIYVERKVAAYMQDRIGPNRVGPFGLLQPIADGLKFLFKEEVIPAYADKVLFLLAPAIAISTATLAFAVVPFGRTTTAPPLAATSAELASYPQSVEQYRQSYQFVIAPGIDIGIVFIFAVTSLTVYAIILGGWASNNKYSFIGALRSSAQIISYEIPMGMSVLGVALLSGSLNLEQIIDRQVEQGWYVWYQPLAFLMFLAAAFAECNRLPFDLPEAEQELVGGYHTEYSALKFGLFFLGEYTHVITTSYLLSILFFGGWHFPGIPPGYGYVVVKFFILGLKMVGFILFYMLIRWTIPRFRYDQLMGLAWKVLIPLALANLVCVMIVKELHGNLWWLLLASVVLFVGSGLLSVWLTPPGGRGMSRIQTRRAPVLAERGA
jgi:NADH-quinone oxidoreductase subunit H